MAQPTLKSPTDRMTKHTPARPPSRGVYTLIIYLPRPLGLNVGSLGFHRLKPGMYAYTGSAVGRGATSLPGRILRHMRGFKAQLWHIDYLLMSRGVYVAWIVLAEAGKGSECAVNLEIERGLDAEIPIPRFGASDCRQKCGSHLLRLEVDEPQGRVASVYESLGLKPLVLEISGDKEPYIRPVAKRDFPRLYEIERECFGKEAYPRGLLAGLMLNSEFLGLLAETNSEIAGFILGSLEPMNGEKVGHVYTLDVAGEFRRTGVASKLLRCMERLFWLGGAKECYLEVRIDNLAARGLYWKSGYKETEFLRDYYGDEAHGLRLKKGLKI